MYTLVWEAVIYFKAMQNVDQMAKLWLFLHFNMCSIHAWRNASLVSELTVTQRNQVKGKEILISINNNAKQLQELHFNYVVWFKGLDTQIINQRTADEVQ